jgi:hypothetical protein
VTDYTFTLTAGVKARGRDAAFGAGVVRVEDGQSGRGERSHDEGMRVNVRVATCRQGTDAQRSA